MYEPGLRTNDREEGKDDFERSLRRLTGIQFKSRATTPIIHPLVHILSLNTNCYHLQTQAVLSLIKTILLSECGERKSEIYSNKLRRISKKITRVGGGSGNIFITFTYAYGHVIIISIIYNYFTRVYDDVRIPSLWFFFYIS